MDEVKSLIIPAKLHKQLKAQADKEGRMLQALVVGYLRAGLAEDRKFEKSFTENKHGELE